MSGFVMKPLLLCDECGRTTETGGLRGVGDFGSGRLTCSECGGGLIQLTVGVVKREPTVDDLSEYSLNRYCRGTFYR